MPYIKEDEIIKNNIQTDLKTKFMVKVKFFRKGKRSLRTIGKPGQLISTAQPLYTWQQKQQ